jgi:hypothetical protein
VDRHPAGRDAITAGHRRTPPRSMAARRPCAPGQIPSVYRPVLDKRPLGYPFNRSSLSWWNGFESACITRGQRASFRPGSAPTGTAWTTWSGCAGQAVSAARAAVTARGWRLGDGRLECARCRSRTSVTAGHDLRPDADAADGMVHRVLAVRHAEGRHLGAEPAAGAGDRLLPGRVGDAGPAAVGAGAPGRGPAGRDGGGGRDLHRLEEPGLRSGRAAGKKVLTGIAVEVNGPGLAARASPGDMPGETDG